jgi:hypothetical protein
VAIDLFSRQKYYFRDIIATKSRHFSVFATDPDVSRQNSHRDQIANASKSDNVVRTPIKLTTSGRGKLTTCFAGEDFQFMSVQAVHKN